MAVARELGRRWIGIDASPLAIRTSVDRLTADMDVDGPLRRQMALFDSDGDAGNGDHFDGSFLLLKARSESIRELDVSGIIFSVATMIRPLPWSSRLQ